MFHWAFPGLWAGPWAIKWGPILAGCRAPGQTYNFSFSFPCIVYCIFCFLFLLLVWLYLFRFFWFSSLVLCFILVFPFICFLFSFSLCTIFWIHFLFWILFRIHNYLKDIKRFLNRRILLNDVMDICPYWVDVFLSTWWTFLNM